MSDAYYLVGDLAREFGLSVSGINKWVRQGKIARPGRSVGGVHIWTEVQMAEVRRFNAGRVALPGRPHRVQGEDGPAGAGTAA